MKQKNYKIFFVLAVFFAILAAFVGVYGYNTVAKMVPVIVASQDINADEAPTGRMVAMSKEPAGSLKSDSITDAKQLKGMVAKGFIPAGTPLRMSMFQPSSGAGLAARLGTLDGDKVAIALPPSADTTVGNSLRRGDKVSVKAAAKDASNEELTNRAEVLDVPNEESGVNAVVLAVSAADALKIKTAQSSDKFVWCELLPPNR